MTDRANAAGGTRKYPARSGPRTSERRNRGKVQALLWALALALIGCVPGISLSAAPATVPAPPALPVASSTPSLAPSPTSPWPSPTPSPSPTFTQPSPSPTPPEVPAFSHIFVIVMEDKGYGQIVGNPQAPTIQSLIRRGALLTNYYAVTHPSLPNYLALIAGTTFNMTWECDLCFVNGPTLADQIEAAGRQWKVYNEDIPAPCFLYGTGEFDKNHDAFLHVDSIRLNAERCTTRVISLDSFTADLASSSPPDLMWIVPNECHTMHPPCGIADGDSWLAQWVPLITNSRAFQAGGVLFLTFDEDEGQLDRNCRGTTCGGHVVTIVLSPWVLTGVSDGTPYTHYSLLRTIEDAWGLPYLGAATQATAITGIWSP